MVQLTDAEYCTCALLFLEKHPEYHKLWLLSECIADPELLDLYCDTDNIQEAIDRMDEEFIQFVKTIDTSQLFWNITWKLAAAKIHALQMCHNDNNNYISKKLDIPLDVVRALRIVLEYDESLT